MLTEVHHGAGLMDPRREAVDENGAPSSSQHIEESKARPGQSNHVEVGTVAQSEARQVGPEERVPGAPPIQLTAVADPDDRIDPVLFDAGVRRSGQDQQIDGGADVEVVVANLETPVPEGDGSPRGLHEQMAAILVLTGRFGEAIPPLGEGIPPLGDELPPSGGGLPPLGEGLPPSGEGLPPSGEGMPPSGEGMPPLLNAGITEILELDDFVAAAVEHDVTDFLRQVLEPRAGVTLDRLEDKGLIRSRSGDANPSRGGRPRRYVGVTPNGVRALKQSRETLLGLWRGLEDRLQEP